MTGSGSRLPGKIDLTNDAKQPYDCLSKPGQATQVDYVDQTLKLTERGKCLSIPLRAHNVSDV